MTSWSQSGLIQNFLLGLLANLLIFMTSHETCPLRKLQSKVLATLDSSSLGWSRTILRINLQGTIFQNWICIALMDLTQLVGYLNWISTFSFTRLLI